MPAQPHVHPGAHTRLSPRQPLLHPMRCPAGPWQRSADAQGAQQQRRGAAAAWRWRPRRAARAATCSVGERETLGLQLCRPENKTEQEPGAQRWPPPHRCVTRPVPPVGCLLLYAPHPALARCVRLEPLFLTDPAQLPLLTDLAHTLETLGRPLPHPRGSLLLRPVEEGDVKAATVLLTRAFATTGYLPLGDAGCGTALTYRAALCPCSPSLAALGQRRQRCSACRALRASGGLPS